MSNNNKRRYQDTTPQSRIPALILPKVTLTYDPENFYYTGINFGALAGSLDTNVLGYVTGANKYDGFATLVQSLNLVQLGTTSYQRTGRAILVTRIEVKMIAQQENVVGNVVSDGGAAESYFLVLDKQYNGLASAYTGTEIWEAAPNGSSSAGFISGASLLAYPNRANEDRFVILKEQHITWNDQATINIAGVVQTVPTGYANLPYEISGQKSFSTWDIQDVQIPIMFNDGNAGYGIIASNNLTIIGKTTNIARKPFANVSYRITYKQLP